jgi:hypothetical protein
MQIWVCFLVSFVFIVKKFRGIAISKLTFLTSLACCCSCASFSELTTGILGETIFFLQSVNDEIPAGFQAQVHAEGCIPYMVLSVISSEATGKTSSTNPVPP